MNKLRFDQSKTSVGSIAYLQFDAAVYILLNILSFVCLYVGGSRKTVLSEAGYHGDAQRGVDGIPGAMPPLAPFGAHHRGHRPPVGQHAPHDRR